MEIVRLGQGVDRTGRFVPEALERTFAACRGYAQLIESAGAEAVRFVATSATRDAANRDEFVSGVRAILGVDPEVVSGDEEAALSFAGATRELDRAAAPAPYLVVDIGGGSTEFVLGDTSVRAGRSVDIGCVRMTERHLRSDPPTATEIEGATADIRTAISRAAEAVPLAETGTLVGVAGSVTTVAAMALNLPAYDSAAIHLARISADDVRRVTARLLTSTREERAALPFMHPGRVDVIGAGALVLATIVDRVGVDAIIASEHDILDGIAWSLA
jgi:exopolyphosphatase/guanosine-5'-triphosphate,3'-diphosphate pyrophosphatase